MQTDKIETLIARFLRLESSGGIILMIVAVLAMIFANTALAPWYDLLLSTPVEVRVGALLIAKPLLLWINDGLMAMFFFLVGLELKRELLDGELSEPGKILLPMIGAVGGMAMPALVYLAFNHDDPVAAQGWAIPAATDIAFALGVLMLLGSRVPTSLKIFLTSLAIFDDLGAIIIIAAFYTANISFTALAVVAVCLVVLLVLNQRGVMSLAPYLLIGIVMWVATLKSGVHATLAGVLLAMFIPLRNPSGKKYSPLKSLEHDLHPIVAYFVLPVFAFANAGIALKGLGMDALFHDVPFGIAMGLVVGKQVGVFGLCALAVLSGIVRLPSGMSWLALYGVSALAGIGFTMSLFIGSLAFEETGVNLLFDERLGIIVGSLISGVIGYCCLRFALPEKNADAE